ncbi:MAG: hypothetical protein QI197_06120 [Candidatus Korarchaeota archaeon]|nr:hypothetical protein [Candidatus Korarchaeota archaeon]
MLRLIKQMSFALMIDLTTDKSWREMLSIFLLELERIPGVLKLIALPSPDDRIYESNVLVVVREYSYELVLRIMEAAVRAERRAGVHGILSPTVATPDEPVVSEFEEKGMTYSIT